MSRNRARFAGKWLTTSTPGCYGTSIDRPEPYWCIFDPIRITHCLALTGSPSNKADRGGPFGDHNRITSLGCELLLKKAVKHRRHITLQYLRLYIRYRRLKRVKHDETFELYGLIHISVIQATTRTLTRSVSKGETRTYQTSSQDTRKIKHDKNSHKYSPQHIY